MMVQKFREDIRNGRTVTINRQPFKVVQIANAKRSTSAGFLVAALEGDWFLFADLEANAYFHLQTTLVPFKKPLPKKLYFQAKEFVFVGEGAAEIPEVFGEGTFNSGDKITYSDYEVGDSYLRLARVGGKRLDLVGRKIPPDWVKIK